MDLTSKARDPYVRFSPFYPHGEIPVPFSEGVYSQTVEGVWQGLKVFESEGIDTSKFNVTNMEGIKRTIRTKGPIIGHQKGVKSTTVIGYLEARLEIYLPTYKFVLEHKLSEFIDKLKKAHDEKDLVFLDYDTNSIIGSTKPLSHAFLVKSYLENNYPDWDNYETLDSLNATQVKKNKTVNKKNQTTLF
jgi:hypothetical protein